ncbi:MULTISPECIES: RHS repeat-associated core domain-containing protein [Photorhabdus]|uniref:RHS repeat-associated core domain-containing protein n=1 Tax=Photorhabdus luminescens TaxID=29488 RepID=A0A1G5RJH4_PHOLU|nr:RHS repeat-associated core domain-containing protein [Photorhabdus luminescens]SCZ74166.1 RHS repeat-associated core domain-containing protein [Photorhabdus luminescens]
MSLGDEIVTRIARVGAQHAVRVSPPQGSPGPAAAREGDPIKHASFLGALAGAITGALIGAAVFAAASALVGLTVLTGGLATVAVIALGTAATFALGDVISAASSAVTKMVDSVGPPSGALGSGSPNVFIEGKPAARATADIAACSKHPAPPLIAQGSETVFINGSPAARVDDKLVCGATIKSGAKTVFIGSGQGTYLEVAEEFSAWERAVLIAVEFLVPPSRGAIKGLGKLFTKQAGAKAVSGAIAGARQAGKILSGKTFCCAKTAFRETRGVKRYREATKKFFTGDPIDVTTGQLFDQRTDITLGQTLPLVFLRSWAPEEQGLLGPGWADSFSECALTTGDRVEIRTTEGASLYFALPPAYTHSTNPDHPDFTLSRGEQGYILRHRDSPVSKYFALRHPSPAAEETSQRWLLTELRDVYDNRLRFIYNEHHQLTQVIHSDGPVLTLRYNLNGQLTAILRTDEGLQEVMARYHYHDDGRLAEADSTQNFHLYYEYNAQGLISRWSDGDQTWVDYRYDSEGRCTDSIGAGGFYPVRLDYAPGMTRSTTPQGHTTTWHYNEQQQVTEIHTPCGSVTRYEYDRWGNLVRQILPMGETLTLTWLADTGRVTSLTDAAGAVWQYSYDADSLQLTGMTDPLQRTWLPLYDEQGQPAGFIAPDGRKTTLTRNAFGLVTSETDTDGNCLTQEYDKHQRLVRVLDEENRTVNLGYDSQDRLRSLTAAGALWRWRYDRHHRVAVSDRPDNHPERFTHDRHGNLTCWTDARGVKWQVEYGPFDLPVARRDGEGHRWQYRYDADTLQLTQVINPQGETYSYTLDADGRVIAEQDYAGTQWHYRYDLSGNCIEKRDGEENLTRYDYDAARRLTALHTPEGVTRYHHDILGRLLTVESPDSALHFEYDDQDRIVREIQPHGEIQRRYPDNRAAERQLFTGETAQPIGPARFTGQTRLSHWQSRLEVNRAGELIRLTLEEQSPLTIERDDAGRDTGRYVEGGFILRQQYNLMGQLTAQRAGRNPHFFRPAELEEIAGPAYAGMARRYEYDAALNLTAASDDGQQLDYLLNGNGQVMSVGEGRTLREHYQYDAAGYPSRRFDGVQEIMGETLYQEGHRLNWVGSHRFVYDRAGRVQEKQFLAEGYRPALTTYRWNSQNQLTGLITPDDIRWEYRYDAFGRRTEKRCIQTGKLITYLWDGDVPAEIREYQHGRLKMVRHLVFDGWELIAQQTQQFTLNLDNRVELMAGEVQTQYAVSAPTGEPLALFDPAGKRVWRRPKQSLYGLRLGGQAENPQLDPGLRFAGQLWDEESGLCYNRHRFYSPEAACYLSPDPTGLWGGENTYSYVHNPTGWLDPLGLAGCSTLTVNKPKILSNPNLSDAERKFLEREFRIKQNALSRAAKRGELVWSPGTHDVRISSLQNSYRKAVAERYERMFNKAPDLSKLNADHPVDLIVGGSATQRLKMLNESINKSVGSSLKNAGRKAGLKAGDKISEIVFI